ncbi:jg10957 [Pararge aegeria aegeria]|uniref:Jg10957 protein n=1 Tax=Pararge aegeria aegeria TaxID=348720 RepID=A0A8S4SBS5_9NEOP|nr:jg10957 [Pararge aegeria aegeria]
METEDEVLDGTIISVLVQNFMCHDHFKVEFKKRVTFIVGRNGSGKSAILTALVVGLGGKASETNRGKNFQSFVKKGANSATIEIKIKNSGPGAYKPEEYGEVITIIKIITASGASSYKMRSISGQLIHTNAKVVNAIVLNLNIQVNNPISVLNQDDAKDFSVKKDPTKLYSLFMRATNLDVTEENYERARMICKSAIASCEKKNKYCMDLKNDFNKWNKMYEQMQSRKDIEKQLKLLKVELGWSEIAGAEREVATIRQQCLKQSAKCERMETSLQAMDQTLGGAATTALEQQLEEFSSAKAELEQQLRPLERTAQDARQAHGELEADLSRHVEALKREKRRVCDYEREIEYRSYLTDGACSAEQSQQKLRELESRGSESLAVYGASMVELCRRVRAADEQGHFSATPRGPIGQFIKVKEQRWDGVLEHIIGGLMRSFCVNTAEDSRKLFRIMDQVWRGGNKPSVTCSKFLAARHDVRATSVRAPPHVSALDTLQVDDPVVANFLIDNLALERVLLVPDHDSAVRLADTAERVPRNCNKIVTLDCSEYHPAPSYRSYGGRAQPARLLHLDTNEYKRQLRMEIEELETHLRQHDLKMQTIEAEKLRVRQTERSVLQELKAMGAALLKRQAEEALAVAALEKLQAPQQAVLIEKTAADHLQYCFKLKNDIGRHIGIHFMATLITRGYNGQIVVDHMKDTLELRVSGREGSRSASSAASLSGGERSYTTVAFITSLWECVELPFYFMDEFDVFMVRALTSRNILLF